MSWRTGTFVVWAVLAAAVLALWALAVVSTRAGRHGTDRYRVARPAVALQGLLARRPVRLVLIVGWMWLGWHLFAR